MNAQKCHTRRGRQRISKNGRLNGNSNITDRMIARENFQLVTTSERNCGTSNSRNEKQLAQAIRALQVQQNRRLSKMNDKIFEAKIHRSKFQDIERPSLILGNNELKFLCQTHAGKNLGSK